MGSNLTDRQYWERSYVGLAPRFAPDEDEVAVWIRQHCAPGTGRALEIGCFPGQYLTVFGELGYQLNGIDLVPRVEDELPEFLRQSGFRVGKFETADMFRWKPAEPYDVVCSFGLIEHFTNWPEVLAKHFELVKPGGKLIISAPNFRGGLQKFLHLWLDKQNLAKHHLPAMNPPKWAAQAEKAGFKIEWQGYFGHYDFWFDDEPRSKFQKEGLRTILRLRPRLRKLKPGRRFYSPFCGMVATKEVTR